MIKKLLLFILIAIFLDSLLQAQEVSSGKTYIKIDIGKVVLPDSTPPLIKILSPVFTANDNLQVDKPEIDMLGKITDENSGINRIFINMQKYELKEDGLFMQKIPLERGENKILIVAVDNKDNYSETKLMVEYKPDANIATSELSIKGKYYALLIGVSEYEDPNLSNLDYPVKDAEKLYNILLAKYMFNKEDIILLKNARRSEINDAFDILARRITPNDNLLIFYAGHGWWDEKSNIGYWLPRDAKREYKADWFRNSTLCDYISEINSKHTLLITDACFGGSIFKTRSISIEAPKAIQMLYDLRSRKAMTSGTLTEVPDRSSFVKYLIGRLEENKEKCISSEQLFASFRLAVINNSDVIPQYGEIKNVGDEGGDFIFIRKE